MVNVNFGDVDESVFDPPERGWQYAEVDLDYSEPRYTKSAEQAESDGTKAPKFPESEFWNVCFRITRGEDEGKRVWTNFMLPPYNAVTLKKFLVATGEDATGEKDLELGDLAEMGEVLANVGIDRDGRATIKPPFFAPIDEGDLV